MNHTVHWRPAAEDALARLWTEADDREAVARAADEMDALLRRDPVQVGESRASRRRILIVRPLAIYFEVLSEDRMVFVTAVWRWA